MVAAAPPTREDSLYDLHQPDLPANLMKVALGHVGFDVSLENDEPLGLDAYSLPDNGVPGGF
jgi:hypothetical protein